MLRLQQRVPGHVSKLLCRAATQAPWIPRVQEWSRCTYASSAALYPPPREGVAWQDLGFGLTTKDTKMVVATCRYGQRWSQCQAEPYGPFQMEPAATVLNYGQSLFEGLKAYRTSRGRIVIFRPHKNAQRMARGAERLSMPQVPLQLFMEAVNMAVVENSHWVPPVGEGALYLRPLLFGCGSDLGVKPSSQYTLVVYVAPVGKYFSGDHGVRMRLCTESMRAAPTGIGHIKAAGNYAQCFNAQKAAKADGFSDVIYLDVTGKYIEEAAASNFFCVDHNKVVHTPQLGTILPGVTRDSVIQFVRELRDEGFRLEVNKLSVQTVLSAAEAFVTGTGASIVPVEHISGAIESVTYDAAVGPVTQRIQRMLADVQLERRKDRYRWLHDPFVDKPVPKDSFVEPAF